MKSAWDIAADSDGEEFVRRFDLREIDARPPSFWTRRLLARLGLVERLIVEAVPPGSLVLDVGCAQGNIAIRLAERGYRCIGLDLRLEFLKYARKKDDAARTAWVVGDALLPPVARESVDAVVIGEILEHVAEPAYLLNIALSLVRPGGIVVCTTPNGQCLRYIRQPPYAAASRDMDSMRARQCGPAGDDHLFALRPSELLAMVPGDARAELRFAVSAGWNRGLSWAARSGRLSNVIEILSAGGPWRTLLCENLVLALRRR